jgi:hypothetical protein
MSVSLTEVEGWLGGAVALVPGRSWRSLESLLRFIQSEGLNPSRQSKAVLERVEIADDFTHEGIIWAGGRISWLRELQVQGTYQGKLSLFLVEIQSKEEFVEPDEIFQFVAETPGELLAEVRSLLRLQNGQSLSVHNPLHGLSWSEGSS